MSTTDADTLDLAAVASMLGPHLPADQAEFIVAKGARLGPVGLADFGQKGGQQASLAVGCGRPFHAVLANATVHKAAFYGAGQAQCAAPGLSLIGRSRAIVAALPIVRRASTAERRPVSKQSLTSLDTLETSLATFRSSEQRRPRARGIQANVAEWGEALFCLAYARPRFRRGGDGSDDAVTARDAPARAAGGSPEVLSDRSCVGVGGPKRLQPPADTGGRP